jgi:hypothetical protein
MAETVRLQTGNCPGSVLMNGKAFRVSSDQDTFPTAVRPTPRAADAEEGRHRASNSTNDGRRNPR